MPEGTRSRLPDWELLAYEELISLALAIQHRLDPLQKKMSQGVELTDKDLIELEAAIKAAEFIQLLAIKTREKRREAAMRDRKHGED